MRYVRSRITRVVNCPESGTRACYDGVKCALCLNQADVPERHVQRSRGGTPAPCPPAACEPRALGSPSERPALSRAAICSK